VKEIHILMGNKTAPNQYFIGRNKNHIFFIEVDDFGKYF